MSAFEWWVVIGLGMSALMLFSIVAAFDRANKHLSNIANRILDVELELRKRR